MFLINLLKNEFDSGLGGCVSAIEGRTSTTAHTRVKGEKTQIERGHSCFSRKL